MTDPGERARTALAAANAGARDALGHYRGGLAVERKEGKTDLVTRADREAEEAVLARLREDYPDETVVAEESASATGVPESGPAWVVDPIDGTNNFVRDIPLWGTAVAAVRDGEPEAAAVVLPAIGDAYLADDEETRRGEFVAERDEADEGDADADQSALPGDPVSVSERSDPDTMAVATTVWWGLDRRDEYATATSETVRQFGDLVRFRSAQLVLAMVSSGSLDATFTNLTPHPWDSIAGAHLVDRAGGRVTDLHGDPWRHDAEGFVASNGHRHDEVCAIARAVQDAAADD